MQKRNTVNKRLLLGYEQLMVSWIRIDNRDMNTVREFKLYDATVAKTSLKIASSSLSIFFVIISVCVTFESGAVLRLGKKIQICVCVFTFSLKLEKWSFHVADLSRTGKKCTELIEAREGRAKVSFLFIKYAKFVGLSLPSRRIF